MRIRRLALPIPLCMLLAASAACAKPWWMRGIESNDTDFLPPDVAFRVGATVDGNVIRVRWVIADGYYLYRHKMAVAAQSPDLLVAGIVLPRGVQRADRFLGNQEVFLQQVEGTVPFKRFDFGAHPLEIKVTYQGCAEAGLCYPPITRVLFPEAPPSAMPHAAASHVWEGIAIAGGAAAFLVAGLMLRKGRRLDPPPP